MKKSVEEKEEERAEYLKTLGWEILDFLPKEREEQVKEDLILEIIAEGWDKKYGGIDDN